VVVAQLLLLTVKTDHLVVAQDLSLPPEVVVLQTRMQTPQTTTKVKPTVSLAATTGIQQTVQRVVAVVPVR